MLIEIAVEAARVAGEIQRQRFGGSFGVRHKGAVDLVTEVDLAAGCLLVREAGGTVTGFASQPFSPCDADVVASNGPLQAALLQALDEASGAPVSLPGG